jgi:hypothetical protein
MRSADCAEPISMTLVEYEAIRAEPTHFGVVPEHELPEIESVVRRFPTYFVVEKREQDAQEVARYRSAHLAFFGAPGMGLGTRPRSNPTSKDHRFDRSVQEIGLRDLAAERKDHVDRAQPRRGGSAQDLEWRTYPSLPSTQK